MRIEIWPFLCFYLDVLGVKLFQLTSNFPVNHNLNDEKSIS